MNKENELENIVKMLKQHCVDNEISELNLKINFLYQCRPNEKVLTHTLTYQKETTININDDIKAEAGSMGLLTKGLK